MRQRLRSYERKWNCAYMHLHAYHVYHLQLQLRSNFLLRKPDELVRLRRYGLVDDVPTVQPLHYSDPGQWLRRDHTGHDLRYFQLRILQAPVLAYRICLWSVLPWPLVVVSRGLREQ
jgi:hypothetical protein